MLVRAPERITDERIEDIIEAKRYWIYKNLAEWRDLKVNGCYASIATAKAFSIYLGRSYRLLLAASQKEPLLLRDGRFCLRRDTWCARRMTEVRAAFRDYYATRGKKRLAQR